ncbi:MAG: glycosyltransferase [Phascolarctobacterium sp.]|nr:glycosyltransferase [Phascolarctobacterium sp.]
MYTNYSVLMSVYFKEKPDFLRQSMESILNQTIKTDDFILVCDGPLNEGLDAVIAEMQTKFGEVLHVVRLEKNGGLGNALNEGMKHCKNELVARMDSDDISYPDRCERQLTLFNSKPEVSICSGIVEEFSEGPEIVDAKRVPPEYHQEILEFAKSRNPFNHPCVMYKKAAVEAVGSYQDFYLLEDYYLWVRMLMAGYKGYNIQESLLHMRAGSDMYRRRGGWRYIISQVNLFRFMHKSSYIGLLHCIKCCVLRLLSTIVPNTIREYMYSLLLRK